MLSFAHLLWKAKPLNRLHVKLPWRLHQVEAVAKPSKSMVASSEFHKLKNGIKEQYSHKVSAIIVLKPYCKEKSL